MSGHPNFQIAMLLKTLGADPCIEDFQGMKPAQLLLKKNSPEKAAELEGRPMNQEELRLKQALEHPLAQKFEQSIISTISWIISQSPEDGFGSFCNNEMQDDCAQADHKLSNWLDGVVPKAVVLELPITRYCEVHKDLWLTPPPEGFTVKGLLMEVYKFYQDPFTDPELSEIRQQFGIGSLGDTFGYISRNVAESEGEGG